MALVSVWSSLLPSVQINSSIEGAWAMLILLARRILTLSGANCSVKKKISKCLLLFIQPHCIYLGRVNWALMCKHLFIYDLTLCSSYFLGNYNHNNFHYSQWSASNVFALECLFIQFVVISVLTTEFYTRTNCNCL